MKSSLDYKVRLGLVALAFAFFFVIVTQVVMYAEDNEPAGVADVEPEGTYDCSSGPAGCRAYATPHPIDGYGCRGGAPCNCSNRCKDGGIPTCSCKAPPIVTCRCRCTCPSATPTLPPPQPPSKPRPECGAPSDSTCSGFCPILGEQCFPQSGGCTCSKPCSSRVTDCGGAIDCPSESGKECRVDQNTGRCACLNPISCTNDSCGSSKSSCSANECCTGTPPTCSCVACSHDSCGCSGPGQSTPKACASDQYCDDLCTCQRCEQFACGPNGDINCADLPEIEIGYDHQERECVNCKCVLPADACTKQPTPSCGGTNCKSGYSCKAQSGQCKCVGD